VFAISTPAHNSETWTKKRWTRGRASTAGSKGQKSCAKRWVNGRRAIAEPMRTNAISTLQAIGWMK
jgi:hypothetical protein